jgi:hypothetical protein
VEVNVLIPELLGAICHEAEATTKGNRVKLQDGKFLSQLGQMYHYQYSLAEFQTVPENGSGDLVLRGKKYRGEIISSEAAYLQLAFEKQLPAPFSEATFNSNTKDLLEFLAKNLEEHKGNPTKFVMSQRLFNQTSGTPISHTPIEPSFSQTGVAPNTSQCAAIRSSLNDSVSIIWGPPGTGKTATIARAIESHLNVGRTVLLLSHANNAVDQALVKLAEQTKESYYPQGVLLRLGQPKAETLPKLQTDYPLVLPDNVVAEQSKDLLEEKDYLLEKLKGLEHLKTTFILIIQKGKDLQNLTFQLEVVRSDMLKLEPNIRAVTEELKAHHLEQHNLKEKLSRAATTGLIGKIFLGLRPAHLEQRLNELDEQMSRKADKLTGLFEQKKQAESELERQEDACRKATDELTNLLANSHKSLATVKIEVSTLDAEVLGARERLTTIDKELEKIKADVFPNAKFIATTLTQSFMASALDKRDFDVVIVDEVGMAPMPALYWAASKATKAVTIVGDFKQLPPIGNSSKPEAEKWFKKSIFDHLNIGDVDTAKDRVKLLNIQYRMHPLISEISRDHIYRGYLRDDPSVIHNIKHDNISGDAPFVLLDTSAHNPWCTQLEPSGRCNPLSALISLSLVEKIAASFNEEETIGIITPYKAQADLLLNLAKDKKLFEHVKLRINTIHSFQGGEETAIIFDAVEGPGSKPWSYLKDSDDADLLLNVALTRARAKLYVVAHLDYFERFPEHSLFKKILKHGQTKGKCIASTDVQQTFVVKDSNDAVSTPMPLRTGSSGTASHNTVSSNAAVGFTHDEFWTRFPQDLQQARRDILIFSPYMTMRRVAKLEPFLKPALAKGVSILVVTLPPTKNSGALDNTLEVLFKLRNLGINIKFRDKMHEKIILIDKKIKWFGSLNILSHSDRLEYMERFEGEAFVTDIIKKLKLSALLDAGNRNGELCPKCAQTFLVPHTPYKAKRTFLRCADYANCRFELE